MYELRKHRDGDLVIDPLGEGFDDEDIDELEADLLRQGASVLREHIEDEQGVRWGLRVLRW